MGDADTRLTYFPQVFDVATLDEAKAIILTNEAHDTDTRWVQETEYLCGLLGGMLAIKPGSVILDYGCGIGRLAKVLIERYDCTVIGVDISPSMRMLAGLYVNSDRFIACSLHTFSDMIDHGLRVDGTYAVWVLQHCLSVLHDVAMIHEAMTDGAKIVVVNDNRRIVPTVEHRWVDDGVDVKKLLAAQFAEIEVLPINTDMVAPNVAQQSFIGHYWKRRAE